MTNNYTMFEIANTDFYEKINLTKLKYIIHNQSDYEDIIKAEESDMRRIDNKNYNAFSVFHKIHQNCIIPPELEGTEFAYIKVKYNKGFKSNDIGRWYADKSIGLAPLCCSVRHTICEGIWNDIDQVNSHPTIFKQLMDKLGCKSPWLKKCFRERELFLQKIMNELKCDRNEAKTKVIGLINGGGTYKSKIP